MKKKNTPASFCGINSFRTFQLCISILASGSAIAGTTWDGGDGSDNWNWNNNWNPDGAPSLGTTVDLTFAGSTRLTPVNNYAAWSDLRSIYFASGAGAFTLSGNALDLFSAGKIENNSTNTQTVNFSDMSLNSGAYEFNPVSGDLVIATANIYTNGNTINVWGNSGKTLTISGGIQQDGKLVVNQNSTVVLSGNNTVNNGLGQIDINAGKVVVMNTNSLDGGSVYLGNGGTPGTTATFAIGDLDGGTTVSRNIYINSGTNSDRIIQSLNTSGTNTFSGNIDMNGGVSDKDFTIDVATGGTAVFSGTVSTAANKNNITKIGGGTASFSGTVGVDGTGEIGSIIVASTDSTNTITKTAGAWDANQILLGTTSGTYGTFNNAGGTRLQVDLEVVLGRDSGSTGTWVNGSAVADIGTGDILVGKGGTGTWTNSGSGTTRAQSIIAGYDSTGVGTVNLSSTTGGGTDMQADDIIIGKSGTGTLNVVSGDLLVNVGSLPRDYNAGNGDAGISVLTDGDTPREKRWIVAGYAAGSTGTINQSGGTITTGDAVIGRDGTGILTISGGTFTTDNQATSNVGTFGVPLGDLIVGDITGTGTATITAGTLDIKNDLYIGKSAGASGTFTANGGTVNVNNNDTAGNFGIAATVGASDTLRITSNSNSTTSFVVKGHTDVYGTLTGAGHLNQDNATFVTIKSGGNITPDDSVGVTGPTPIADLTVSGLFKMDSGSTANMQIAAGANTFAVPPTLDSASYDQVQGITSSTAPEFNGLISVTNALTMTTSDYQVGMAFDLFNWDNEATVDATGSPTFSLPALPAGLSWFTNYFLTGGVGSGIPYDPWQSGPAGSLVYNPGTIIVVPEPSATLLFGTSALALAFRRRRSQA